jgi:hypothetical protein
MLRRIPATPLVCLVIFLSTVLFGAAWAAGPDESLEVLLKPGKQGAAQAPTAQTAASRRSAPRFKAVGTPMVIPYPPAFEGICKVKAPFPACFAYPAAPPCILATPGPRQWELSAQVFFATIRGNVAWPRYNQYYAYAYMGSIGADLVDHLQLPRHDALPELGIAYQFRPNWSLRYSVLFKEFNGGGTPWDFFWFGNQAGFVYGYGQNLQSKWQHAYHRIGLQYDALRTCNSRVSVFGNWVHMDDRIDVGCQYCGYGVQTFSKGTDAASVGFEVRRCLKTMPNGGTLSCEYKAAAMFLDNVEGWDVEAGARYSIPLNSGGRWGYMKGGYRLVDFKKNQNDFAFKNTLEGGFMEMGFIF